MLLNNFIFNRFNRSPHVCELIIDTKVVFRFKNIKDVLMSLIKLRKMKTELVETEVITFYNKNIDTSTSASETR